jgi:hypothetical protein
MGDVTGRQIRLLYDGVLLGDRAFQTAPSDVRA